MAECFASDRAVFMSLCLTAIRTGCQAITVTRYGYVCLGSSLIAMRHADCVRREFPDAPSIGDIMTDHRNDGDMRDISWHSYLAKLKRWFERFVDRAIQKGEADGKWWILDDPEQ